MQELQIKKHLVDIVIDRLHKKIELLKKGKDQAQADANEHVGAMESRYDTFKEEAQTLVNGFAMQIQKTSEVLALMQQLVVKINDKIEIGTIVETETGSYFISTGLIEEPLEVAGIKYDCVNLNAPIINKIRNKSFKLLNIF